MNENYPNIYLYKRIVHAKLFIDSHFAEQIDLDNIADEANFSKFHFIRLFKSSYGKTPYRYLSSVRMNKALELLQKEMAVSEVCIAVGFESLSSFSGLFKRTHDVSPSLYQIQQKSLKSEMIKAPLKFVPACFANQHGWTKNSNFGEANF